MPQRYGDFATWAGSLGTIAAFAVAFAQIHRERSERKRRELREWLDAKREHADRVSAWVSGEELIIQNGSHHLIHRVVASAPGLSAHALPHVEPGRLAVPLPDAPPPGPVALSFTDARGERWHRAPGERPVRAEDGADSPAAGTPARDLP